jgi:hypothetical protein
MLDSKWIKVLSPTCHTDYLVSDVVVPLICVPHTNMLLPFSYACYVYMVMQDVGLVLGVSYVMVNTFLFFMPLYLHQKSLRYIYAGTLWGK